MTDIFRYDSPFGILGKIFNKLILKLSKTVPFRKKSNYKRFR